MIKWHPPYPSFVKINFDALVQHNKAAIGFVIRDSNGNPLTAAVKYVGDTSVLVVETLALKEGLHTARLQQMHHWSSRETPRSLLTASALMRSLSYADLKRRQIEFDVGDHVFLKVSPTKGVVRFGKNGKLAPRYVGPFEILERVGDLAYRLALPPVMSGIHNVFHVSLLRMYIPDASHVIDYGTIKVNADATFVVEPVRILDRSTKRLRRKEVDLVKVCWSHYDEGDASWELESDMRAKYPRLFLG
ncbi:hypothetical protein ACLB2K_013292 [Fragaria x ananassa]